MADYTDLWTSASTDVETETAERLFTAVRLEAAQYWPVVAGAETPEDFNNRMSMVSHQLDRVTASVLDEDTQVYYPQLRRRIATEFASDYSKVANLRLDAALERRTRLQTEARAELTKQAEDGPTTTDPDFLAGPAEGQTGPAAAGGTPGSETDTPESKSGGENDDSKGPNIIDPESIVSSSMFRQAAVDFQRRHYNHIADAIKSAPVDEETREALARHFADHLSGTNPQFSRDRFIGASTHTASKVSRLDFKVAASATAGEGAYVTDSHNSGIRKEVDAGTAAHSTQAYVNFMGGKNYDWAVDGIDGDGWQLGGNWDKTASKTAELESWDTNEVSLHFDNDYGLYQAAQQATSAREFMQLWESGNYNDTVDVTKVDWNQVYQDFKESQDEIDSFTGSLKSFVAEGEVNDSKAYREGYDEATNGTLVIDLARSERPDWEDYYEGFRDGHAFNTVNGAKGDDGPVDMTPLGDGLDADYDPKTNGWKDVDHGEKRDDDGKFTAARHTAADPGWIEDDPDWWENKNKGGYGMPNNHPFWKNQPYEDHGQWRVFDRDGKTYGYNRQQNAWYKPGDRDTIMGWVNGFNQSPVDINASLRTAAPGSGSAGWDSSIDSRTACSQCGNKAFDGSRCHACGYTGHAASHKFAYDYAGNGWHPEGPGQARGDVWVGHYADDPNPELGSWLVHHKENGSIVTDSFPDEESAVGFAGTK